MKYSVKEIRKLGYEARWTRTRSGAPIIVARKPGGSGTWFAIDKNLWDAAKTMGFDAAFESHTMLGDIFSVPI